MCQIVLKHVLSMKAKSSTLEMKHFVRERKDPLLIMSHESIMVNEADMDFRIPGLPHSVVKLAQSTSFRELLQKIENHPDRHALQLHQRQNQSFNFFQNQNEWFRMWVTSNIVNCSRRNPKRSAQLFIILEYHSTGNQFERFWGFLELIRRFEFEYRRFENHFLLKDSNFWCVHVNVPWPVCAHAIPIRMLWLPRWFMVKIFLIGGGGRGGRRQTEPCHLPQCLQNCWNWTASSAQRMIGGIGNVLLSTYSQTWNL